MAKKKPAKRKIKQADKPADGMRIEFVSVAELLPYATNARTHSPEQVKQIADSILEFGFTNPVLIDANNELVAGHGRVMAAKELGHDLVPCIRLGHLSELQVRAYRLADNKIALNSGWDFATLAREIEALGKADIDLLVAGFSAQELTELFALAPEQQQGVNDPNAAWAGLPEFQQDEIIGNALCCLVRFKTEADRDEFQKFLGWKLSHKGKSFSTWFPKSTFDQLGTKEGIQYEQS